MIPIEAEQALIGACILNIEVVDLLDGMLKPEDFGEPVHALIFNAIIEARHEGRRIDMRLLVSLLGADAKEKIEGTGVTIGEYVASMVSNVTTTINARDFARVIVEHANYRRLEAASKALAIRSALQYGGGTPADIAAEAINDLDEIVSASAPNEIRRMSIGEAGRLAVMSLNDTLMNGKQRGITWGLTDLDRATLGMRPGQLIVLAARPSAGKTTVGISVARSAAQAGHGVMFVSLEMIAQELAERALADLSYSAGHPVAYSSIIAAQTTNAEAETLIEATEQLDRLPISIEQQGGLTVSQVVSRARTLRARWERRNQPLSLIIIDHLGLLQASGRYAGQRHAEVGEITGQLKALAKEMGVAILLLCQLNRAVEGRENKRPQLSDLRESGRIEEDADSVIFLYREAYYLERQKSDVPADEDKRLARLQEVQHRLEISIAKQRQGPTQTVNVFVSMAHNAVRDLARTAFAFS